MRSTHPATRRTVLLATALAILIGALAAAPAASAVEGAKPIQIALFDPVQIFPRATPIHGVRLNILYGNNSHLCGVDFGLVNRVGGDATGYQAGIVGWVEGDFRGWQNNYINVSKDFLGFQSGVYNQGDAFEGVQFGFVNVTESMNGFQLAFVNVTQKMHGLQIGLVNVIQQKEKLPVLPIVNWQF